MQPSGKHRGNSRKYLNIRRQPVHRIQLLRRQPAGGFVLLELKISGGDST